MRPETPNAPEAEISVLGAMLIDGEAVARALELVDEGMFYREPNRYAFRAMASLFQTGVAIDPVSLAEWLTARGALDRIGGMPRIAELLDAGQPGAHVEYHCDIIRERFQRRRIIEACNKGVVLAHDPETQPEKAADAVGELLSESVSRAGGMEWIKKILYPTFQQIEDRQNAGGGLTGLATGLADLDEMTGGIQKGDLVVIAARPSMGKTALVTGLALHAAISEQKAVAFFSFEMSKAQVVQRMLAYESLVDLGRIVRGRLRDDDFGRLAQAAGHLNTAPIFIEDGGEPTVTAVKAGARRIKREQGGLGLIVVDYMQLMDGAGDNRNQEVSEISKGLKRLAKELEAPVVALSQLSRAPEQRSNHRPILSDLRESGSIEQDADLVGFLYRPEYYDPHDADLKGKAELIVSKHRNGPTDTIDLYFRKECARFESGSNWGVRAA